jgi:membrane protein involved in colicin uptake
MKHFYNNMQDRNYRVRRVSFLVAAISEEKSAEKKEKGEAEQAQREAREIAENIENAEAEAEAKAAEEAKEKLRKQTRTIFAGGSGLTETEEKNKTTFGV